MLQQSIIHASKPSVYLVTTNTTKHNVSMIPGNTGNQRYNYGNSTDMTSAPCMHSVPHYYSTETCRLVEGAKAEVHTVVNILSIVLVYTDSHNTMAILVSTV
jgi:hypothetical protein